MGEVVLEAVQVRATTFVFDVTVGPDEVLRRLLHTRRANACPSMSCSGRAWRSRRRDAASRASQVRRCTVSVVA